MNPNLSRPGVHHEFFDRSGVVSELSAAGFTFSDLLATLFILCLVSVILMPAVAGSRQPGHSATCLNNLRQIGQAMLMYAADNNDTLYNVGGFIPNGGEWYPNPTSNSLLSPSSGDAYWGIAYLNYVSNSREVFRCPSARKVDEWRDGGLSYPSEFWLFSTYGVSKFLTQPYSATLPSPAKLHSVPSPGTMILAQDAAESRMEGLDDTIGLFPGYAQILNQWLGDQGLSTTYYGGYQFQWEWYRHDHRCQTLFLSGNTARIPFNGLNVGIDYRYYTGDKPLAPLP